MRETLGIIIIAVILIAISCSPMVFWYVKQKVFGKKNRFIVKGRSLDNMGLQFDVKRKFMEFDNNYRKRILDVAEGRKKK